MNDFIVLNHTSYALKVSFSYFSINNNMIIEDVKSCLLRAYVDQSEGMF